MSMTREEHDKAMDALGAEWAECADSLVDRGYSFDLVWVSMLMFVFQVMVHQRGKDTAWKEAKELVDKYFRDLSLEEEALIRRGSDPTKKAN
jgi:hypothetical protein